MKYYKKLLEAAHQDIPPLYKSIAGGNLGINYYKTGAYQKAIPLLQENIKVSKKYKVYGSAMESAIWLGDLFLKSNEIEKADQYFHQALRLLPLSSTDDKIHHTYKLYKGVSKLYAVQGDKLKAQQYMDSFEVALQQHNQNFSALKLMRANQTINDQQAELLQKERLKEIRERNLIIGIVIGLFIILIGIYIFKNKYNQKKLKIKELAYARSKESLAHARQELGSLSQKIKKNNRLIEELQKNDHEKNKNTIQELQSYTILTAADWRRYQLLFEKVYPKYLTTLRAKYPDLTPGELRYLCLEKVNLSAKEIASILGVAYNSVMVTRHRIRKKLHFKTQKELEDWVYYL